MAIYTKFGKQKTIKLFIKKLYSIIDDRRRDCVETYHDSECTILQCNARKLRSFDDIYDCVKTYYPNTTIENLFHILLTIKLKDKNQKRLYLHMSNCSTISRIRLLYYHDIYSCLASYKCKKYDSKYSWIELLDMLGLTTEIEIINYINKIQN